MNSLSSWDLSFLFFFLQVLLILLAILLRRKGLHHTQRLFSLFIVIFLYHSLLTFYGWMKSSPELYVLLGYAQLLPLSLFGIVFYAVLKRSESARRSSAQMAKSGTEKNKYEKTGLSESFSLELKEKLEDIMLTQKPYLNQDFKLDDIADLLNISRHHASQVINENFKMSFYDFTNKYRIEEAKLHLQDFENKTQSISDIAYECGFNNRVSFYKAFKKITRTTPTTYLGSAF
ncbi:MAG: helix-turn-helix domain-containing protein [Bacteroidota bacterium]